ncbi:hypothetical protein YGH035_13770 [Helicobacter pylori]
MWGADLFKCNRIDYFVPNHVNDSYYPKYKRAGIKFISIDPIYTETAQAFSAEWIPIRPNTDVALDFGMGVSNHWSERRKNQRISGFVCF